MKKIYIKEDVLNREIEEYLKPEYIYLEVDSKLLVQKGSYLKKGTFVTENKRSSISGIVIDVVYKNNINNKKVKYLIVENDYKEKEDRQVKKKNLFIPLDTKYVLINGIDEVYTSVKRSIINRYAKVLLNIIDNCVDKSNIVYICLSNGDSNSYFEINKYIGSYPNIEIVRISDFYFNNNNSVLIKEVFGYDKKNVSVIDIINLYKLFNRNEYNTVITIKGTNIKSSGNVIVKEGTLLSDVINYLGGYINKKNILITVNGVLGGIAFDNDDIVIDRNIQSVFITNKAVNKSEECICCGKCLEVCPVNLAPMYIMNNRYNKNILKRMDVGKCLECGICSFVCPSGIDLKEYIRTAKEKMKDE